VYYEAQQHGWDPSPPKRLITGSQLSLQKETPFITM